MAAKVFISCGQRESGIERRLADALKGWFAEHSYDPYVAYKVQDMGDVMEIIHALEQSDYFVFADLPREALMPASGAEGPTGFRGSLFSHQEFAIAHYLGFREDAILLQHRDIRPDGFLPYLQANPVTFDDIYEAIKIVEEQVKAKGWRPEFSRHFFPDMSKEPTGRILYFDRTTGPQGRPVFVWGVYIKNRHPRRVAFNVTASLREVIKENGESGAPDKAPLKWAGQNSYSIAIQPQDSWSVDALAFDAERPHLVLLNSLADAMPFDQQAGRYWRAPIIDEPGLYHLRYRIDSLNFPPLDFEVELNVTGDISTTRARLISTHA